MYLQSPRLNQLIGFVPYINTNVGRRNRIHLAPKDLGFGSPRFWRKTTVSGSGTVSITLLPQTMKTSLFAPLIYCADWLVSISPANDCHTCCSALHAVMLMSVNTIRYNAPNYRLIRYRSDYVLCGNNNIVDSGCTILNKFDVQASECIKVPAYGFVTWFLVFFADSFSWSAVLLGGLRSLLRDRGISSSSSYSDYPSNWSTLQCISSFTALCCPSM